MFEKAKKNRKRGRGRPIFIIIETVAQLAEQSLLTPEIRSLNPVDWQFFIQIL